LFFGAIVALRCSGYLSFSFSRIHSFQWSFSLSQQTGIHSLSERSSHPQTECRLLLLDCSRVDNREASSKIKKTVNGTDTSSQTVKTILDTPPILFILLGSIELRLQPTLREVLPLIQFSKNF
jgi:hypothetical protein